MFFTDAQFTEIARQFTELRESDDVMRREIDEYNAWVKARKRVK